MFVGRTAELALLRAELRAAGGGPARRVAVEGPEGIGKTALIHHALGGEAGARVLIVSGEESERELPLGVVRQLMEEAALMGIGAGTGARGRDADGPPSGETDERRPACALDVAMGEPDPWAAGQAVCDLLGRWTGPGVLVVVVDDAQWVDRPSSRALGYALRRVRAGRVLVVVACRDLADPWLPEGLRRVLTGDDALHVTLGGLSAADLAELAADPAPAARRPDAALEVLRADAALAARRTHVGADAWRGDAWRGDTWPGDAWPGDTWRGDAVLADGLGAGPGSGPDLGSGLGPDLGSGLGSGRGSGRGSGSGLGEVGAGRLCEHTLGNPLHARALLATLPQAVLDDCGVRLPAPSTYRRPFARRLRACAPVTRRLVAACAVLGGRCPLHVAAAIAGGIDEPLNALEEAVEAGLLRELPGRLVDFPEPLARAAAYDGIGAGARARLHLEAARLTEDAGDGLRHRAAAAGGPDEMLAEELVSFAVKAAQHGLWQEAAAHLDLAAGLTESAARRDELRTAVLEHVLIGGDVLRAAELAEARNADPRPVRRYVLGRLALASGRFDEASELLAEAWRQAEPGFAADVAEQLAWLRLVTGDREAAATWARLALEQPIQGAVARPYDVLALGGAPGAGTPPDSLAAAVTHLARGEAGPACVILKRAAAAARRAGLPHHRLLATALLAVAEHALARWDEAARRAEGALAEAAALGQRWLLPCLEVACVAPLAARGEHVRARAHATAAGAAARRMRHTMGERQASLAMALLGAQDALGGCGGEVFVPDPRPARIEALVADGRPGEAERELAAYDEGGSRSAGGPRREAERLRLGALLMAARNVPTQAEEGFGQALALVGSGVCPLEEARVLLDLGRLLRRTGRRRVAAERLGAARAIFERLGARPLVERCAHEMEACGLEPPATVRLGLTPQELSTATLVAGGLTNRQIARELLISVKTVEYHIGKIYTKLGIGSRVALAAKLTAQGPADLVVRRPEVSVSGIGAG
ncbi:helix-turn-helix transcriptional regulator [Nonomuraea insulae]|uniref:AAA family ATPase n=1 Tax=Nonomuraea insulae TaxID=1616787 RepID=A0ABW1CGA3_9ACTN